MKHVFILLMLCGPLCIFAQTTPPNDKAKVFYDKFLKIVEEIKKTEAANPENKIIVCKQLADNAKAQIEHIKRRDAAYDTKPLEAIVQPYIDAHTQEIKQHNDRIDAQTRQTLGDDGCVAIFQHNTTVEFRAKGEMDTDIANHIEQLKKYNAKVEKILSNPAGVETCEKYIRDRIDLAKNELKKYVEKINTDNLNEVKLNYRELIGFETYWSAAARIFPNMKEAAEVHQLAKDALATAGTMEQTVARCKAKRMEYLKKLKIPAPVVTNAALEAEFKEAFNNEGWGETIIKVSIQTREWSIVRHSISGAILYRTQYAYIVAKQKAGNCMLYGFTIKQQYTGSGYSSISSRAGHDVFENEFLCENAQ